MPRNKYFDGAKTEPRLAAIAPDYGFRISLNEKWIVVKYPSGVEKPYRVSTLIEYYLDRENRYTEEIRAMAKRALEEFGKLPKEKELTSGTLAVIQGVKVYQELGPLRRFIARVRGETIKSKSLTELEKVIRGG